MKALSRLRYFLYISIIFFGCSTGKNALQKGDYDAAVSKATFAPAEWLLRGTRLVRKGGRVLALVTAGEPVPPGVQEFRYRLRGKERGVWIKEIDGGAAGGFRLA